MKKIFCLILLFISVVAYAQIGVSKKQVVAYARPNYVGDCYLAYSAKYLMFTVGDYVFKGPMAISDKSYRKTNTAKGGEFNKAFDTEEEAKTVCKFINANKEEIQAKYDVVITRASVYSRCVSITLYDRETYENSELARASAEKAKVMEREDRIMSLSRILQ